MCACAPVGEYAPEPDRLLGDGAPHLVLGRAEPKRRRRQPLGLPPPQLRIGGVARRRERAGAAAPAPLLDAGDRDPHRAARRHEHGDVEDAVLLRADELLAVADDHVAAGRVRGQHLRHGAAGAHLGDLEAEAERLVEGDVLRAGPRPREERREDDPAVLHGLAHLDERLGGHARESPARRRGLTRARRVTEPRRKTCEACGRSNVGQPEVGLDLRQLGFPFRPCGALEGAVVLEEDVHELRVHGADLAEPVERRVPVGRLVERRESTDRDRRLDSEPASACPASARRICSRSESRARARRRRSRTRPRIALAFGQNDSDVPALGSQRTARPSQTGPRRGQKARNSAARSSRPMAFRKAAIAVLGEAARARAGTSTPGWRRLSERDPGTRRRTAAEELLLSAVHVDLHLSSWLPREKAQTADRQPSASQHASSPDRQDVILRARAVRSEVAPGDFSSDARCPRRRGHPAPRCERLLPPARHVLPRRPRALPAPARRTPTRTRSPTTSWSACCASSPPASAIRCRSAWSCTR